jgi:hypothetical protein
MLYWRRGDEMKFNLVSLLVHFVHDLIEHGLAMRNRTHRLHPLLTIHRHD